MRERQLRVRIAEHILTWVKHHISILAPSITQPVQPRNASGQPFKTPVSSIARHHLTDKHCVDPTRKCSVIYAPNNTHVLRYAGAVAIKQLEPSLGVQKDAFVTLALSW
ncbi:unnamed protein product [Dicrocoelium dendriticum]|nr:unnamed protein product [Dicrocoelium dendriticum]